MSRRTLRERLPQDLEKRADDIETMFRSLVDLVSRDLNKQVKDPLDTAGVVTACEFLLGYVLVRMVRGDAKELHAAVEHHHEGFLEVAGTMLEDFREHVKTEMGSKH